MNILMIGGTGFISGCLVGKLLEQGHRVSIVTRGTSVSDAFDQKRVRFLKADRAKESEFRNAVGKETFDVVYDMIAYDPRESELAARMFKGRVGRFVHCSTVSVYMVSVDVACPITEDQDHAPLMEYFPRNPFGMDYGINKRGCEDVLWCEHDPKTFPVSMLRPPYVCGPGDPSKRDFFWIERILDGGPILVPGSGDHAFQNVYVEDVASAFAALTDHDGSVGQAFNVAGDDVMSLNEYLRFLTGLMNRTPEIIHVEQDVFDGLPLSSSNQGDVFPFNTRRTAIFSLEKIKSAIGFKPTSFSRWMPRTIQWFSRKSAGHSNGYEKRPAEISFAIRWKRVADQLHKEMKE